VYLQTRAWFVGVQRQKVNLSRQVEEQWRNIAYPEIHRAGLKADGWDPATLYGVCVAILL
jgi:hypothetical protein